MIEKPDWFEQWEGNDFQHMKRDMQRVKRDLMWDIKLTLITLSAIIAAAVVNLFMH